jgi:uncharacterized protein YkwD
MSVMLGYPSLHRAHAEPDDRCFEQTGYCISGPIRTYWELHGGLPVFGYPVTPLRQETIEGTWTGPVQWFERDRLEDHGSDGVMAGRLGARILELRGIRWQDDFDPVDSASSDCFYFSQTKHSLCDPFLSYWQRHGGLERFGYPISEPYETTIDGWYGTIQYFERRRMEHHTEYSGTPYEVLLGLLGNEVLGFEDNPTPTAEPYPVDSTPTRTVEPPDTPTSTSTTTPTPPATASATSTPHPTQTPQAELNITKFAPVSEITQGEQFVYIISISSSNSNEHTIEVEDRIDTNLSVVEATADTGNCEVVGQLVTCSITVRNNMSSDVVIEVKVDEDAGEGTIITNQAEATDGTVSLESNQVKITVEEKPSTQTPTPTPAPTDRPQTPTPTDPPRSTDTPAPTATPRPTDTAAPTATPRPTDTPAPTATSAPTQDEIIRNVVKHTNEYREDAGCEPLVLDDQLTEAAQRHSKDMATNDFFSHTSPSGVDPWERIKDTGYSYSTAAENIYAGATTAKQAVDGWFNSQGHRENMLNCNFEEIGVGYYYIDPDPGDLQYKTYWTQVFAKPSR